MENDITNRKHASNDEELHQAAFASLDFRKLPWGVLSQRTFTVYLGGETSWPIEGVGHRFREYIANVIYVLSDKSLKDVDLWRCSDAASSRPLLLVDRRVGFGRHVWCLLDFTRPGDGKDVHIRVHRLIPRHLDIWDYTLLRFLGFPLALVGIGLHLFMRLAGDRSESDWFSSRISTSVAFITAVLAFFAWLFKMPYIPFVPIPPELLILVVGLIVSGIIHVMEANRPRPDIERYSAELMMTVQQAVQTATVTMQPAI